MGSLRIFKSSSLMKSDVIEGFNNATAACLCSQTDAFHFVWVSLWRITLLLRIFLWQWYQFSTRMLEQRWYRASKVFVLLSILVGTPNPYCTLELIHARSNENSPSTSSKDKSPSKQSADEQQVNQSSTVKNSSEPKWHEQFELWVFGDEWNSYMCKVCLWSRDSAVRWLFV